MKVSICMITYNHEKYIDLAIKSVLDQKVSFDYEMVIGDDCSKDQTRKIIERYMLLHPDKIRLITSDKNVGPQPNFLRTFYACKGEYVALLEGDDYWTEPLKLQQQINFLEAHPEYVACFTNALQLKSDESGNEYTTRMFPDIYSSEWELKDFFHKNPVLTLTVCYRNIFKNKLPAWFSEISMGDWCLHILHARYGKFKYLSEVTAVYRIHAGGMWSMVTQVKRLEYTREFFEMLLMKQLVPKSLASEKLSTVYDKLITLYLKNKQAEEAKRCFKKLSKLSFSVVTVKSFIKLSLHPLFKFYVKLNEPAS